MRHKRNKVKNQLHDRYRFHDRYHPRLDEMNEAELEAYDRYCDDAQERDFYL